MLIGDYKEFQEGQLNKVERCKKQEARTRKGMYQMHVMIESECTETLEKERQAAQKDKKSTQKEGEGKEEKQKTYNKTDIQGEMEKMLATANRNVILK